MSNAIKGVVLATLLSFSFPASAEPWQYQEEKDEMRGIVNKWAALKSENLVPLEFPYAPGAHLLIYVRSMPKKYGTDVFITATKGQLTCSYNNCYFNVKFDDGKIQRISAVRPDNGEHDTLFVSDRAVPGFIKKLKAAKKVFVEVDFFRQAGQQFKFDPEKALEWK